MDSVAAIKAWAEQRKEQTEEQAGDKKTLFGGGSLADAVTRLSDGTILLPETATYLLHGLKNYSPCSWRYPAGLDKSDRAELWFTQMTERAVLIKGPAARPYASEKFTKVSSVITSTSSAMTWEVAFGSDYIKEQLAKGNSAIKIGRAHV